MKLVALFLPMLTSLVGKIIAAFGISIVTYVGFDLLVGQLKTYIIDSVQGAPAGLMQMFYISGGGVALNILFGALTFMVSFKSLSKLSVKGKS